MRDAAIDPLRQPGRNAARSRPPGAPPLDGLLGEGIASRRAKPAGRQGGISSAAVAAQRLGGGRIPGGARRRAEPGLVARLRGRLPRVRPFKALTIATFSIALVGIVTNAMMFQRGRHPAPLFGFGQSADPVSDAAPRIAAPPPPNPPAAVERTGTVAPAPPPVPAVEAAPPPAAAPPKPVHHAVTKPHHEDGIGGLLASAGPAAAAHPRPGHAAKPSDKPAAGASAAPADPRPKVVAKPGSKAPAKADAALANADPAHHVKLDAGAHPRPHAAGLPSKAADTRSGPPAKTATD